MEIRSLWESRKVLSLLKIRRYRNLNSPPRVILFPVIWVTNRCNLRCRMCDQWRTDSSLLSQELKTKEWFSIIDSAYQMCSAVISIAGGEPLLRSDIFDILSYIHRKGLVSHLVTNGTLLNEDTVNRLKRSGVNSISVSLDSYIPEIHNNIRGVDCFNSVVKGIGFLKRNISGVKIGINYVITKQNFLNMYRMISFAEKLEVNQIKFDPIYTNLIHRRKSLSSFEDLIFDEDDLPELDREIDKLIRVSSKTKLLTNSSFFLKGMLNLYKGQLQKLRCYAGYISCSIDPLGWVSPCENFDGNENIRDKPLEKIWRSSSFQKLRQKVHACRANCWDTTHGELNIRCSLKGGVKEFSRIFKELDYYFHNAREK